MAAPILTEATKALNREDGRGDPVDNFHKISAIAWEVFGIDISGETCCKILIALKLMRLNRDPEDLDSKVDLAAYFDILERIQAAARPPLTLTDNGDVLPF